MPVPVSRHQEHQTLAPELTSSIPWLAAMHDHEIHQERLEKDAAAARRRRLENGRAKAQYGWYDPKAYYIPGMEYRSDRPLTIQCPPDNFTCAVCEGEFPMVAFNAHNRASRPQYEVAIAEPIEGYGSCVGRVCLKCAPTVVTTTPSTSAAPVPVKGESETRFATGNVWKG